jgi:uncharacterized membrane protein
VIPVPGADILPNESIYYGVLIGVGFALAVYAHAARMPRLLAFSILLVFAATLLTLIAARGFDGDPGVPLP